MSNRGIAVAGAAMLGMVLLVGGIVGLSWPWRIVAAVGFASVTCAALALARKQRRLKNPVPWMLASGVVFLLIPLAAWIRGAHFDSGHVVSLVVGVAALITASLTHSQRAKRQS